MQTFRELSLSQGRFGLAVVIMEVRVILRRRIRAGTHAWGSTS